MFQIKYTDKLVKQIKKLDRQDQVRIRKFIEDRLIGCEDPKEVSTGKMLVNNPDRYRYRIGKYRLICEIKYDELIILALKIKKRDSVYKHRD